MKYKKVLYKDKIEAMFILSQLKFQGRKGNPNKKEKKPLPKQGHRSLTFGI